MRKSPSGATGNMRFVRKSAPTRLLRMTLLVALLAIVTIVPALSITQPGAQLPQEPMRATTSSAAFDTINAGWDQVVPYGNKTCVNGSAVFSIRAHNPMRLIKCSFCSFQLLQPPPGGAYVARSRFAQLCAC